MSKQNHPVNASERIALRYLDIRGCPVFVWRLSNTAHTGPVICRLPQSLRHYVIHAEGWIEKRMPPQLTPGMEDIIRYSYVDAGGESHLLGDYRFIEAQRHRPGNVEIEGSVRLVDLRQVAGRYRSGHLSYGLSLQTTTRYYIGDVALASLLGALLEVSYDDIVTTGFSDYLGRSVGGSTSHVNGTNGDFRYLREDRSGGSLHIGKRYATPQSLDEGRQKEFVEALYKFGWTVMLSYRYVRDGENRLLPRTRHAVNHHHHLHLQGYAPTVEEVHD